MSGSAALRGSRCAAIALGALIAGYLWGFGVGEREGLDSDAESGDACYRRMYEMGYEHGTARMAQAYAEANGG